MPSSYWLWIAPLVLALGAVGGCAGYAPPVAAPMGYAAPVHLPLVNRDLLWDAVVDVVDDYFRIDREERLRLVGDVEIEGRIDTFYEVGSTLLEPWRGDSANAYERLESTLQTIRRVAYVRVIPTGTDYLLDVQVFKELEDPLRPEHATAGAATFRNDTSLERYREPVGGQPLVMGWIPLGRDPALEQRITSEVQARVMYGLGHTAGGSYPLH